MLLDVSSNLLFIYVNVGKFLNDVWISTDKGSSWTNVPITNAPWSARNGHTSVALDSNSNVDF